MPGGVVTSKNSINAGMASELAEEIGSFLTDDGVVIIAGCQSGTARRGIQIWANRLGHTVIATTGDVSDGIESKEPWFNVDPESAGDEILY